jgi:hypothetical protein
VVPVHHPVPLQWATPRRRTFPLILAARAPTRGRKPKKNQALAGTSPHSSNPKVPRGIGPLVKVASGKVSPTWSARQLPHMTGRQAVAAGLGHGPPPSQPSSPRVEGVDTRTVRDSPIGPCKRPLGSMMRRELIEIAGDIGYIAMAAIASIVMVSGLLRFAQRESKKIHVWGSMIEPSRFSMLRVGHGAILTIPGPIGGSDIDGVLSRICELISDDVTHIVVEVEGPVPDTDPLARLVAAARAACTLGGAHLSLITLDTDLGTTLRQGSAGTETVAELRVPWPADSIMVGPLQ